MNTNTITSASQAHPHVQEGDSAEPSFPRRILVCLSLSPRASAIAAEAWRLAQATGAECQFLHVGYDCAETRFDLRDALVEAGVPWEVPLLLHPGKPRQVVEQMVHRHDIDLVVAGVLNRRTTFSRHFRSVAGQIAATAPCSVLLLTDPQLKPRPLERFIISADFDDLSRTMLASVRAWGRREGARLWHVVHEYDPSGFYSPRDGLEPESRASCTRRLGAFIRPYDWAGQHLQLLCLPNKHGCDAVWYAQTMRADVLCLPLSLRRQRFWERMLRFRLDVDIHALPCAVLLFREKTGAVSR